MEGFCSFLYSFFCSFVVGCLWFFCLVVVMSVLYALYQFLDCGSEDVWVTKWNLVEFMAGIFIGAVLRYMVGVLLWVWRI